MKKTLFLVALLASVVVAPVLLAGCDEETHADPKIKKAMDDQRAATAPQGGPTPRPGKTTPGK